MTPYQKSTIALLTLMGLSAAAVGQAPERRPAAAAGRTDTMARTERAFPTGDRATSIILLERLTPMEVRPGDEFRYEIRLTNLTRARIENVTLSEDFPQGMRIRSVGPMPTQPEATRATWQLSALEPGSTLGFQIIGSCDRVDRLIGCANITLGTQICSTTRVVEPMLALRKSCPPEAMVCDEIPMSVTVSNTGSGVARDVKIMDTLPPGMKTTDGRAGVVFDVGDLAPGQSRDFPFRVRAGGTGEFRNVARATEAGGMSAEAQAVITIRKPELTLVKRGPEMRYLGRDATFELTVTNTGDAPANDTVIADQLPAGAQFRAADQGGQLAGGNVVWNVGTIPPGQSRTVRATIRMDRRGRVINTATARAYCAEASARADLDIRGVAAILLEVVDQEDPIEVNANEIYTIEVTNQGTAEDTNILVECVLPPEMEFVSAEGPVRAVGQGRSVRFDPLPSLAPKAKVIYKVIVRGTAAGDARFQVIVNSDVTDSPIEETESTHIY